MNVSLTQTLKDMLNIRSNDSLSASFNDSFSNEDNTPVLLPSASKVTIGSNANNLSFGLQSRNCKSTGQALDLIELNIGGYSSTPRVQLPMKGAINGNVVDSVESNEVMINCTFDVPNENIKSPSLLELTCPPPGSGDVSQLTNSNFCKIAKLIDYSWEKVANVNSIAICRNKPLIAYVLDPTYCRSVNIRNKTASERRDYHSQVIRFVNYEKPSERALSRTSFTAPVADIAFAFKSIKEGNEDKLAAIDKNAIINVFEFKYITDESGGDQKLVVEKLFEILPDEPIKLLEYLHIKWCPFVPLDDDYEKGIDSGMSLAVSLDTDFEQFSIDKISKLGIEKLTRSDLRELKDVYQHVSGAHDESIIAVHLSNDATVICTAALDNTVKFFDLSETKLLHNWSPPIQTGDQISCFYFLDDYNYLLENCRHHFWAYLFIGTKNGHISIWDLGSWSAIQKIAIECRNCGENCHFDYKVDISARVITATCGDNAFVFLIDFIDLEVPTEGRTPESISTYPRITKIGRFQIYNEVLSFLVKRQSDVEVDVFWINQKSLERCTVNVTQMTENTSVSPKQQSLRNSSTFSGKFEDDEIELIDSSIKKLSPNVKDLIVKKSTPESTPPSVTLAQMFSKASPGVNSFSDVRGERVSSHNRRSSTPSQEVASLLEGKEDDTIIEDAEIITNDMDASKSSVSKPFEFTLNNLLPNFPTDFKLPENLVTLDQLKGVETSLLEVINVMKHEMSQEITKVCQEVLKTKTELKDVSQVRNDQLNKIINGLIKKLMEQMNTTISNGLEEFMHQLRTEVNDVSIQVNKLKDSLKIQCDIQKQQQTHFEKVVQDLNKRIQESNSQNQQIMKQLQQQLTVTQQLMNGVSSMSRSSSAVTIRGTSMTPQPNDDLLVASLRAQQEEFQKKRAEEERAKQMNAILKKMESKDESVIYDALVQALNMKEPALITRICRQFERNPEILVKVAIKDQTALLSLLQQLSLSDFRQEKWKGKFLSLIAPALDMESQVVRRNLASFLGKLVAKLEDVLKHESDNNLMLVNALLQSYMRQISS